MTSKKLLRYSHNDVDILEHNTRYSGFFRLEEYQLRHKCFDGSQSKTLSREIFERGDAMVLIPYDPVQDNVVLIEQFRPGAIRADNTPWMLEFIAGMFDEDESPVDVAIREAKEEADITLKPDDTTFIMKFFPSPGGTSEVIYLYVAAFDSSGVGGVHGLPEEGEDILVHVMKREQATRLLDDGKIVNAATIIGLQWLNQHYQQLSRK